MRIMIICFVFSKIYHYFWGIGGKNGNKMYARILICFVVECTLCLCNSKRKKENRFEQAKGNGYKFWKFESSTQFVFSDFK